MSDEITILLLFLGFVAALTLCRRRSSSVGLRVRAGMGYSKPEITKEPGVC